MGKTILFLLVILFSILGGIVCAIICFYQDRSQVKEDDVFSEEQKGSSESLNDTKTDKKVEVSSCLSKIDKSVSFSDFTVEVDGLDEIEHNKHLRESQDNKYKRKKQEG